MFSNKSILITGGTGSFGKNFTNLLVTKYKPKKIIIFSRDEMKQFEMAQKFSPIKHPCLRYFIWGKPRLIVVNIPVPKRATTIRGTRLNLGKDQIASKKLTPNVDKRIIIKPKKIIAPVFLLIVHFPID